LPFLFSGAAGLGESLVFAALPLALCSLPLAASLGTASAEEQDGKHEMERAPAAITSLSAASRCASRPPSDPSG